MAVENVLSNFSPIISVGYSVFDIDGIDNEKISEDVLARKDLKFDDTPGNTFNEDSYLPDTPEIQKLLSIVDEKMKEINPHYELKTRDRSTWAHILQPGESTMYHSHENPGYPVENMAFAYYSKVPKNAGNLVFVMDACKRRTLIEVEPAVGRLVIFPGYVPHLTKKNDSGDTRITISGNWTCPEDKFEDFFKHVGTGKSPYLHYIGVWNG